jgi:hypothetical protein
MKRSLSISRLAAEIPMSLLVNSRLADEDAVFATASWQNRAMGAGL